MKIVINKCFGGIGLSRKAVELLIAKGATEAIEYINDMNTSKYSFCKNSCSGTAGLERTDPRLIEVVETLGTEAYGAFAELAVVEIPDEIDWEIHEYDGRESVHEKHRSWS